jgi:L-rhamnose mutarotase
MKKTIDLNGNLIEFEVFKLNIIENNIENVFFGNKKKLRYHLEKASSDKKSRLHKIAESHKKKYKEYLDRSLGEFLITLKNNDLHDYKLYLNKYGDEKYCFFKLDFFQNEKGIYCYIVDDSIKYIGRSRKNFKERINEYGKITPYNCLVDGQATNCNINSKINSIKEVYIGIFTMINKSNIEIEDLERTILHNINLEWNIKKS